jgi:hypothetical protein
LQDAFGRRATRASDAPGAWSLLLAFLRLLALAGVDLSPVVQLNLASRHAMPADVAAAIRSERLLPGLSVLVGVDDDRWVGAARGLGPSVSCLVLEEDDVRHMINARNGADLDVSPHDTRGVLPPEGGPLHYHPRVVCATASVLGISPALIALLAARVFLGMELFCFTTHFVADDDGEDACAYAAAAAEGSPFHAPRLRAIRCNKPGLPAPAEAKHPGHIAAFPVWRYGLARFLCAAPNLRAVSGLCLALEGLGDAASVHLVAERLADSAFAHAISARVPLAPGARGVVRDLIAAPDGVPGVANLVVELEEGGGPSRREASTAQLADLLRAFPGVRRLALRVQLLPPPRPPTLAAAADDTGGCMPGWPLAERAADLPVLPRALQELTACFIPPGRQGGAAVAAVGAATSTSRGRRSLLRRARAHVEARLSAWATGSCLVGSDVGIVICRGCAWCP